VEEEEKGRRGKGGELRPRARRRKGKKKRE
jgi:hypothetical protein